MKNTIKENFSIISNKLINDSRISAGAKGIACYLLSKSEDWQFYMLDIKQHFKESLGQIKKYIKELEEIGFLKRTRTTTIKNGRNTFIWVYDFSIDYIYIDLNCIDTKSIDTKSIDTISIDTKDNDILIYNITNTKITNTNIKGESEEKNNQQETPEFGEINI